MTQTNLEMHQKGLHIIASIRTLTSEKLRFYESCKTMLDLLVDQFQLKKLGEIFHNFEPEGFTAVICLSESHISIHTWPEHHLVNYDIYLSNHLRVNDQTVHEIHEAFQEYFEGKIIDLHTISR